VTEQKDDEPISDLSANCTIPVDELSAIFHVGALTHLVFTLRQPNATRGIGVERIVQARLLVPTDQLQKIGRLLRAGRVDPSTGVGEDGEKVSLQ
jgi:hypothetical protein